MVPPPPPPTTYQKGTDTRDEKKDYHDEEDLSESLLVTVETPLVRHGTHTKSYSSSNKRPVHSVFRSKLSTCYSSIGDSTRLSVATGGSNDAGTSQTNLSAFGDDNNDDDKSLQSISTVSTTGSITTVATHVRDSLLLPFTDTAGGCYAVSVGLSALAIVGCTAGLVAPKNVHLIGGRWGPAYRVVSSVIGYAYFTLWSVCFYPQVILNYRRQSTAGLSNDFAVLNFLGWTFYSAYLCSMFFDVEIQRLYQERFANESSTVQSNDVAFAIHAMILSFIYLVQIVLYGSRSKAHNGQSRSMSLISLKLKPQTWFLVIGMVGPAVVVPCLIWMGLVDYDRWLDYFYVLSFFKLICTLTKYSKQAFHNWKRKSTTGWNIWYNYLECSGGALSMSQIVLDSLDMDDLTGITGNVAKFALGLATILFDAIFFTQHYCLYPEPDHQSHNIPSSIKASDRLILSVGSNDSTIDDTMDDSLDAGAHL